jgi:putative DNA primase/helicase
VIEMETDLALPAAGVRRGGNRGRAAKTSGWEPIVPVPENAPAPPDVHSVKGKVSAAWTYRGPDGRAWFRAVRFDFSNGEKEVLPQCFCRHPDREKPEWRWQGLAAPRPLFNLDRLAANTETPVLVVEGEKVAEAAGKLLPEWVAVTSPGGANAVRKADWGVLTGRVVAIWPDADEPGWKYAADVPRALAAIGAASVAIVQPPDGVKSGWDPADALEEGWNKERARALIEAAKPAAEALHAAHGSARGTAADGSRGGNDTSGGDGSEADGGRRRGPPQRDLVVALVEGAELWHDPSGEAFVTCDMNDHRENHGVRSRSFKTWLAGEYYQTHGGAPGNQAIQDALGVIEAEAIHRGSEHQTYLRVPFLFFAPKLSAQGALRSRARLGRRSHGENCGSFLAPIRIRAAGPCEFGSRAGEN